MNKSERVLDAGAHHTDDSETAGKPFDVWVVNLSDWEIYRYKMGKNGKWQLLADPIGQTCSDDCKACQRGQKYERIQTVPCNTKDYDLYLTAKKKIDDAWRYFSWEPIPIQPECGVPGQSFCVDVPAE